MKETILQIVEQHNQIVKHFLRIQRDMENISEMIALLGYAIEEIIDNLPEKDKNISLQEIDDVN